MNNLNKKQKIIIITVMSIVVIGIYYIYKKQKDDFTIIESNMIETIDNQTQNEQIDEKESKNEQNIKVHVSGAVNNPGVVELKVNSRINDAIDSAGGLKSDAYIDEINLAYILEDGMKIYIPNVNEKEQETKGNSSYIVSASETKKEEQINKKKININTASQDELETLPGIGPSIAVKIINYRKENGKFESIEDIQKVNGIGDSKFNNIKDFIDIK